MQSAKSYREKVAFPLAARLKEIVKNLTIKCVGLMEQVKKLQKDSKITEDEQTKAEKKLQDTTDDAIKNLEDLVAKKEKEILEV